jgi:hypothetical protein
MNDSHPADQSRGAEFPEGAPITPSKPEPVYAAALREILNWLCRSRVRLAVVYLSGLLIWMGLSLYSAVVLFAPMLVSPMENVQNANEEVHLSTRLILIGAFFILQAGFLFGGGKLRVRPGPTRWYRRIVSLIIFSILMAVIGWGFLLTYFELSARMNVASKVTSSLPVFLEITVVMWLFWLAIGILAVRNTDQEHGLGRLIGCLLAGSWIEFAVALPIELVARPRHRECPCASGSWLALLACFPILVWSIGPAIYLLFLLERARCQNDPRHSRRVLLQKSMRDEA